MKIFDLKSASRSGMNLPATVLCAVLVAVLSVSMYSNSSAQTAGDADQSQPKIERTTFKSWDLECFQFQDQAKSCRISQKITTDQGQLLGAVWIEKIIDNDGYLVYIAVPIESFLLQPIVVSVDNRRIGIARYHNCALGSCQARLTASDSIISAFKAGNASLFEVALISGQVLGLTTKLSGFTAAFNALVKAS